MPLTVAFLSWPVAGGDIGEIRAETITSRTREAKRLVSPGAATLIARARAATTVNATRGIVSRVLSALSVVATGGVTLMTAVSEIHSGIMQATSLSALIQASAPSQSICRVTCAATHTHSPFRRDQISV